MEWLISITILILCLSCVFFSSKHAFLEKSDGEPASKHGRPLYAYFHPENEHWFGFADVLMNMGRRYAMIGINLTDATSFPNATNVHLELANYVEDAHPWHA